MPTILTPALLSGSCGKDSALALFHARAAGLDVRWQVTMLEENGERSRSHGIPLDLVRAQAAAQGLELLAPAASWKTYEEAFTSALKDFAAKGCAVAVFGDIDLEAHRESARRRRQPRRLPDDHHRALSSTKRLVTTPPLSPA